jgi:hypothetical protein
MKIFSINQILFFVFLTIISQLNFSMDQASIVHAQPTSVTLEALSQRLAAAEQKVAFLEEERLLRKKKAFPDDYGSQLGTAYIWTLVSVGAAIGCMAIYDHIQKK